MNYEAKRKLLAVLDLQVTLFVVDGKRKAKITARYCPEGEVLSVVYGAISIALWYNCSNRPAKLSLKPTSVMN